MLELNNVSFRYGKNIIFQFLDWTIEPGVYVLYGKNGCGKTTLLECLAGIRHPSSGYVLIDGIDLYRNPVEAKMKLSYMPDKPYVFPTMTARDLLKLVGFAKKLNKDEFEQSVLEHIDSFNVVQYIDSKFSEMSLGTQRKFTFIASLLGLPAVMLLDEPTDGLDECAYDEFVKILLERISDRCTVIMSTHHRNVISDLNAKQIYLEELK